MNKAFKFKNWNTGGKHYVLNATSHNKWVGFQKSVIEKLKKKFGDDFYLVIWTDRQKDNDFFNIPFKKLNIYSSMNTRRLVSLKTDGLQLLKMGNS
ncbi:hypothetical protein [Desulfobacula phenolica]|uniref:Uncharacterized protein n=1 Tax=Desulfobacula phenolica TaxID=90732 RepID=A0A1H2KEC8_9BACT|nr:hypothetical protein [Desulfobacula phenolica]SDU67009.1 hypothetical protein SAMN04487931_1365 [Desulfobacula phenolica]